MMGQELMNSKVLESDYAIYIRQFRDLCILVSAYGYPRIQADWAVYIRGLDPRLQEMVNAVYSLTMTGDSNKDEYLAADILSQASPGKDNKSWDQSSSSQDKRDLSKFKSQMSILQTTSPVDDAVSYMPSV